MVLGGCVSQSQSSSTNSVAYVELACALVSIDVKHKSRRVKRIGIRLKGDESKKNAAYTMA